MAAPPQRLVPIFDLDGTLLDSDAALTDAFVALGIAREEVTFGHVLADECARLGVSLDAYLDAYDHTAALPFPGVEALLGRLERWGVCSNKHSASGRAELERLGWRPDAALFAEDFGGPKRLDAVLEDLGAQPDVAVYVGDTDHDRVCAEAAGVTYAVAGWNPRARKAPGDLVLQQPSDVLRLIRR